MQGRGEYDPEREAGEQDEARPHAIADPAAPEQVDGSEREPRDVQDRAQQVKGAEGAPVPAGRSGRGERGRGEREQGEGEGPSALVGRFGTRVADPGGLREQGRDSSGEKGEAGDHGGARVPLLGLASRSEIRPTLAENRAATAPRKCTAHFENVCTSSVPCTQGVAPLRSAERTPG